MSKLHLIKNESEKKTIKAGKGFYIALAICLIAVGAAVWVTYDSVSNYSDNASKILSQNTIDNTSSEDNDAKDVNAVLKENSSSTVSNSEEQSSELISSQAIVSNPKIEKLNLPVDGKIIQDFSDVPVYFKSLGDWRAHVGIDIACESGCSVKCSASGTVEKIEQNEMWGTTVTISHDGDIETVYSGLLPVNIKVGDTLNAGDEIGKLGSIPAEADLESHLLFCVKKGGNYIDPKTML